MSNPKFRQGPISKKAASRIEKGRLVRLNAAGEAEHAGADGAVFGAVAAFADPDSVLAPDYVAVSYGSNVVDLSVVEGDPGIEAGAAVYAADNGEVSSTGTVQVGAAEEASANGLVSTVLNKCPVTE